MATDLTIKMTFKPTDFKTGDIILYEYNSVGTIDHYCLLELLDYELGECSFNYQMIWTTADLTIRCVQQSWWLLHVKNLVSNTVSKW